tara:strand:- start:4284 stop:7307 length:3024 start_codon:yes stop_codon:yes gene_type:complete
MQINNLHFFDRDGELINLQVNPETGVLEGNIYFEQLSIALYDNENIFILEKVGNDYKFPTLTGGQSIVAKWNENVASNIFLYDVEQDLNVGEFVINKKDSITVSYEDVLPNGSGAAIDLEIPLQLNVGFNPESEVEYLRSLTLYLEDQTTGTSEKIADLLFYGEGEDEDERFRVWLENFGIKFNRQDANILASYDIKEVNPDWKKINASRKSLLVNHSEIYPYIGTYKGLVNFVNMMGYKDALHVKEYWKNANPNSPYFNKLFLVDLTDILDDGKIDNLNLVNLNKNIKDGKQFVKTEFLALTYEFTKATDNFDDDGVPEVVETTDFTVDEIFYKLNQLGKKVKNEILPINVKIKDIIGEFIYFQKYTIKHWPDRTDILDYDLNERVGIKCSPNENQRLTIVQLDPLYSQSYSGGIDMGFNRINQTAPNPYSSFQKYNPNDIDSICDYIEEYYKSVQTQRFPDISKKLLWDMGDSPDKEIGAPIILDMDLDKFTCETFNGVTWLDLSNIPLYWTFENLDLRNVYEITWRITKPTPNPYNFEYRGLAKDIRRLPHFLPYVGEYTVHIDIHTFNGNTSTYTKKIKVDEDKKPEIVAVSRLEDKFNLRLDNLENVQIKDFGTSPLYFPRINVLDSDITNFDIYKNLLEFETFFQHRYGSGKDIYDVEFYDEDTQSYLAYSDPLNTLEAKKNWGLGKNTIPFKISDFEQKTLKDLYFMRFSDLIYQGDFLAGFYIVNPTPGDSIIISQYPVYNIPNFSTLQELVDILNDENVHQGIRKFNYEIIGGKIHAQANYFSREMYHILSFLNYHSPISPNLNQGSSDYTFFHPRNAYSQRLVDYLNSTFPMFEEDTLFLFSKTKDILSGAVQDPYFWSDEDYWRYENGEQRGYLPSTMDENALNINTLKFFNERFKVPQHAPVFFIIDNLDGKQEYIWTLKDSFSKKEIAKVKGVPFFVWKFIELGKYDISVEIKDSAGGTYFNEIENFITVSNKINYTKSIETRLNHRKLNLLSS